VHVKVAYLPATEPFTDAYAPATALETVRQAAMTFFHVADRQERDTYRYYLELDGVRLTDTTITLEHLVDEQHRGHELHFNLIEEITPGDK
jgi:hypothetical protein